jgi:hypothetical protein
MPCGTTGAIRCLVTASAPTVAIGIPNAISEQSIQIGKVWITVDVEAQAFAIFLARPFAIPHLRRYARQLEGVRDLACSQGRTHDGPQEDVGADGPIGQAVTVGRKLRAVVVGYCSHGRKAKRWIILIAEGRPPSRIELADSLRS